jgi:PPIC-type PPIASE domain
MISWESYMSSEKKLVRTTADKLGLFIQGVRAIWAVVEQMGALSGDKQMFTTRNSWWMRTGTVGLLGAAGIGFLAGKLTTTNTAQAAPPTPQAPTPNEADKRFVAYIHGGKVPITREDLGEYLIARFGTEKIDLLVNKVIIETACKEKGIEVTEAEIDAALQEDLKGIAVDKRTFVDGVLKQYGKTMYEWREDVLRPKIQITKLCKMHVTVTEEDIKRAFEEEFGTRIDGRIIIWPKGQEKVPFAMYEKLRSSEEEFDNAARTQASPNLAALGGRIKPFGRGAGTSTDLEMQAFKLKPGQISTIIESKEGSVIFKCDRIIPPDDNIKLDDHRERLTRVCYDKKLALEIPKKCRELRDVAQPVVLLRRKETPEDLERNTKALLQAGATAPSK